jgi:hypothetical protein
VTTDIDINYHNGSTWVDLTNYATAFKTEEWGLQKVGSATVNLESARSDFTTFIANPYRLIRIRAKPDSTWQNLFFGYIDTPNMKTIAGTIAERAKLSLDCLSFEARLAQDYITFDYYALQSALSPYTGSASWTFRKMINDYLAYPNSRSGRAVTGFNYGTGFTVEATTDTNGIDRLIDGTGNWDNQTLFEANRLSCEHIGYDGYYHITDDLSATTVKVAPFNKASIATLTNPFIGEPEWIGGSLADVSNIIFVEGGVDTGIPSDSDRWSEYGYTKYTPKIWSATRTGATVTITDENNTAFTDVSCRVNDKCIKFSSTGSSNPLLLATLTLANTESPSVDAQNRITSVTFALKSFFSVPGRTYYLHFYLVDSSGNQILYRTSKGDVFAAEQLWVAGDERYFNVNIGKYVAIASTETKNQWSYNTGSTFDWGHITALRIGLTVDISILSPALNSAETFGFYVDGFQFCGGEQIGQFHISNPPAVDTASINSYGVHPFNHTDTQISNFEQAQAEAARILNNLHEPIPTLQVKKIYGTDTYGTVWATQLRPSNVVTCQTTDYRMLSVVYDWTAKAKQVDATYNLVTKTSPLPPVWTYDNALRYAMK